MVAVLNLVDVAALRKAWRHDRTDAGAVTGRPTRQLAPGRIFLHIAAAVQFLMDQATACPDSSGYVDRERA